MERMNPAVASAIVLNLIYLITYLILRFNGQKRSFFGSLLSNPIALFKLAKQTKDKASRYLYFGLTFLTPIVVVIFLYFAYHEFQKFSALTNDI